MKVDEILPPQNLLQEKKKKKDSISKRSEE